MFFSLAKRYHLAYYRRAMTGRIFIRFTTREKRKLERLAKDAGLSFSNYVRQSLGLPQLKHGGKRTPARQGKQGKGSHSYKADEYEFVRMADNRWCVFRNGEDTGRDYATLREARRKAAGQPADETDGGKQ